MGKHLSYFLAPGCPAPAKRSPKPRTVLTVKRGQRFGRLTVLLETTSPRGPAAVCRCDCSQVKTVRIAVLLAGGVSSCGCYRAEIARAAAAKRWANKGAP